MSKSVFDKESELLKTLHDHHGGSVVFTSPQRAAKAGVTGIFEATSAPTKIVSLKPIPEEGSFRDIHIVDDIAFLKKDLVEISNLYDDLKVRHKITENELSISRNHNNALKDQVESLSLLLEKEMSKNQNLEREFQSLQTERSKSSALENEKKQLQATIDNNERAKVQFLADQRRLQEENKTLNDKRVTLQIEIDSLRQQLEIAKQPKAPPTIVYDFNHLPEKFDSNASSSGNGQSLFG